MSYVIYTSLSGELIWLKVYVISVPLAERSCNLVKQDDWARHNNIGSANRVGYGRSFLLGQTAEMFVFTFMFFVEFVCLIWQKKFTL